MHDRLTEFLAARQADYRVIAHARGVADHAGSAPVSGWSVAKAVIVKERDGFAMAVIPAMAALDLDRLRRVIGHDGLRPATAEEVRDLAPACAPGAIPPFGALFRVPTFVDRTLLLVREISMPAADLATSIRMTSAEFARVAAARVGDFTMAECVVIGAGYPE